jgi:hypothetical protein
VILNLTLIPSYGALGCCIAALVSQYFCGVATLVTSTKTLAISYNGKSILIYLLSAALLFIFFSFGKNASVNVWIVLAVAVLLSLLVLFTQLGFFKKILVLLR